MKTVMIIEDNEYILNANAGYFRLCDYAVIEAPTLGKARAELSQHTPDLIILDNQFPDGYGLDFFKELRHTSDIPVIMISAEGGFFKELRHTSDIPVIMISAEGGTDGEKEAIRCGADVYLRKPYAMGELLEQVKRLLDQ